VDFYKNTYKIPYKDINDSYLHDFSLVSLFSGGLDSLIGVIDYLENNPQSNVILISHYDPEMPGPKGDQKEIRTKLLDKYKGRIDYIPSVKISLSYSSSRTKETTFRSRSIIFIGLALLVAKTKGIPIMVPENGTVSLNYPLSPSRRSACSTRTTHPTYMKKLVSLWRKLEINTAIFNPYRFNTKGEMVSGCANRDFLLQIVADSNSCGKRGHRANWDDRSASHCGICLPCTYRRAALLNVRDRTEYGNEINKRYSGRNQSPFLPSQQGQDIVALCEYIKKSFARQDVKNELIIGGLDSLNNINEYVDVVLRAKEELRQYVDTKGNTSIKNLAGII
jgi:7-cyano-7-deazaguanine synthase in queuosine biosynthesis